MPTPSQDGVSPVVLLCPSCKGRLAIAQNAYQCGGCGASYIVDEGVVRISRKQFYWGLVPKEDMRQVLATAYQQGYRRAVNEWLLPLKGEHIARYALDESRDGFKILLQLSPESVVLDLGSGWGAVATSIARSCGWMVAADPVLENLRFLNIRAEQEGIRNLSLLHTDPLDYAFIPIEDESIDAAILNGVLEWVGAAKASSSPARCQLEALREVRRVLKPRGVLYIGIENRVGYQLLLGRPDSHSGLRFATILPRCLASLYSRVARGTDYRTYTYSIPGYKRLLGDAGFDRVNFHWPVFTYQDPDYVVGVEDTEAIGHLLVRIIGARTGSMAKRAALHAANGLFRLGLGKYVVSCYAIAATRG